MRKLVLSVALMAFGFSISSIACTTAEIAGTYSGDCANCGGTNTTFVFDSTTSELSGSYEIYTGYPPTEPGQFTNLKFEGKTNSMTGSWADFAGTGEIKFTFTEDCNSFTGEYQGIDGSWDNYYWNGTKQ